MCSQSATVAIGAVPGGAPNALSNPFGDSPFWVTFSPLQRDTSGELHNVITRITSIFDSVTRSHHSFVCVSVVMLVLVFDSVLIL